MGMARGTVADACTACGSSILLPSRLEPGVAMCGVCGAQVQSEHGHVRMTWTAHPPFAGRPPHEHLVGSSTA
jgi:hypothetical protein